MAKKELQRIALKLFNKEDTDFDLIRYSEEMKHSTDKEYVLCCDYVVEIFRIGKTEFKKKYRIKERNK